MLTQINEEPVNELYLNLASVARDRSQMYQLLIAAVRYPTYELAEALINGSFYTEANNRVNWVNVGSGIFNNPLQKLKVTVESIKDLQPKELLSKMEAEYSRLFLEGNQAIIPLYEASFSGCATDEISVQQAVEEVYQAEGIVHTYEAYERADFIGTELEHLYYLCSNEAESWQIGKMGKAKQWKRKQRAFLVKHTGSWGGVFFTKVVNSTELDVYTAIGMLGSSFMRLERGN
ncbi:MULTISPECIES: TorD/DmsD family molecular chaperone [Bacillus]|uniref:TorD/DmsD family molecular chaperone n=1 Tax=Bacillus TaxID=1386 RepID=UPI0003096B6A|nr:MULTISPECIES: molecular chaperone TorD family protein [Bacillus]